jgi:hypothetical protein
LESHDWNPQILVWEHGSGTRMKIGTAGEELKVWEKKVGFPDERYFGR